MIPRPLLIGLLVFDILLPMAIVIVLGTGRLLGAMDDALGQAVMIRLGEAGGVLWAIGLVVLLIAVAIDRLSGKSLS
ncbi:MAG: hypothetical protein ACC645_01505 [Pirellulales bacterium]